MRSFDLQRDKRPFDGVSEVLTQGERQALAAISEPRRQAEWLTARRCERNVLMKLRATNTPFDFSQVRTSVSHTTLGEGAGIVICAGILSPLVNAGIGVDLESRDRKIDCRVRSRLLQDSESIFENELGLLEFWVIKEACFKAMSGNQEMTLPQFGITAWEGQQGVVQGPLDSQFRFFLISTDGWLVALAQRF